MPKSKKAAPKKATKKTLKAAPKKKSSSAVRKTSAPKAVHPLHQSYLHKEQEDFHRNHPNANALIATFIVTFGLLVILYMAKI